MSKYDVAAYIWPAYTGKEPRTKIFWPEDIGEWQTVRDAYGEVKENGYVWDRKPLLGFQEESDPEVMEQQIKMALDHGVNVFIYDWYWYDDRPFLENCLNDGFLKAKNCNDMKFYIMWANHDANYTWDRRSAGKLWDTIWRGDVTIEQFYKIGRRWIDQYFKLDNYYKIDNKPVISIYALKNFVKGFGSIEKTREAMEWLDQEAKASGLDGVHFQFVRWNGQKENFSGVDGEVIETTNELITALGFSSLTHYQFVHFTYIDREYQELLPDVQKEWDTVAENYNVPYFPHVSIGWDNNPRFKDFSWGICKNNTPEQFEKALRMAKDFADKTGVSLITVNSWNEWTETSYLLPDNVYGYGYLEAIKKVFCDEK